MTEENHNVPAYWTHEVSGFLDISDSTLRKWCILLEGNGYQFIKGKNDSRAFTMHDLMVLKAFKKLVQVDKISKENAVKHVIERFGVNEGTIPMQAGEVGVPGRAIQQEFKVLAESLVEIKEKLERQEEFNKRLVERMDQQSMNYIRQLQETKKELAAAAAAKEKKWWEFWK